MPETADDLLRATIAGDAVQLWRYDERAGAWNYLAPFDPSALEPLGITEFARQRYGGGKFKARIRHRGGEFGLSRVFNVDGAARIPDDAASSSAAAIAGASSSSAPPAWIEKILLPIGVTFATALGGYLAKKLLETPAPDPLMVELLKSLRAGAGDRGAMDPLEFQRAISEAEKRGEDRGREFGELKAQVDGAGDRAGDGVAGAIDRGLPALVGVLHKKLDLDERRMSRPINPPPAPPGTPAEELPATDDALVALLLGVPRPARAFLLQAAEGDEPAETYAPLILGRLDDMTYARIPELVGRSDFVDVFCSTYPAFSEFRAWVAALAASLLEHHAAATEEDDASDGARAAQ